jgi:hypothetical protein
MGKVIISQQTMMVLKNFATINGSILIREGNQLSTISVGENAIAQYQCQETFPRTFGIYDLNQFLAGLSLFDDPILEFDNETYVNIRSRNKTARYYFSSPEITLKAAPEKQVNFPGADMEFSFTQQDLTALLKARSVYEIPDLRINSEEDKVSLNLCDKENETSNVYSQSCSATTTGNHEVFMKMDNIRLLPGDYMVKISSKLITEWKHTKLDLTYYIACEP